MCAQKTSHDSRFFLYRSQLYPVAQGPLYPDLNALDAVVNQLCSLPGLVGIHEIRNLYQSLKPVSHKTGFVLQVGDCAELFTTKPDYIAKTCTLFETILQRFCQMTQKTVTIIGRIAGQYAKSRTASFENFQGQEIPSFYGDIVNNVSILDRTPNPSRIQEAYNRSQLILSQIQNHLHKIQFGKNLFTGHEAYLLPYEESLIRQNGHQEYGSSAHFLWIGDRTRKLHHAHLAFAARIMNPIGLKVGPSIACDELKAIVRLLNPNRIPERLSLMIRLGASEINQKLPDMIHALREEPIIWICDPMHGNTEKLANGIKTRRLSKIFYELDQFLTILKEHDQYPGGLHLEASGYGHLTECVDDCSGTSDYSFPNFESACDPRLNFHQVMRVIDFWINQYHNYFSS